MTDTAEKCGLIVTGGKIHIPFVRRFLSGRRYDIVIAADAGLAVLESLGITPDEIVGDMDTVEESVVSRFRDGANITFDIHRPEKDETDTELALRDALEKGMKRVDILGALGGRLDHELANIQLLVLFARKGMDVHLYDAQNHIYLAKSGMTVHSDELYGKYISFIPMSDTVEGLTLTGFKYPLSGRDLSLGSSLCISNELKAEEGMVSFRSGILICVESHD